MITPTTKTCDQIAFMASKVLLMPLDKIQDMTSNSQRAAENRYMIFSIMETAGYTHQQIADYFKIHRESVTKGISKLNVWLDVYQDTKNNYQRLTILVLK